MLTFNSIAGQALRAFAGAKTRAALAASYPVCGVANRPPTTSTAPRPTPTRPESSLRHVTIAASSRALALTPGATTTTTSPTPPPTPSAATTTTTTTTPATLEALDRIRAQGRFYAVVEMVGFSHLVTQHDTLVLHNLRDVDVGDVIEIDRVKEIGSKDFTIRGRPYVSPEYFKIKATVVQKPIGKEIVTIKFKKRKNYRRRVLTRQHFTTLKISEVEVKIPENVAPEISKVGASPRTGIEAQSESAREQNSRSNLT